MARPVRSRPFDDDARQALLGPKMRLMGWIGNEGNPRYVAYARAHGRDPQDQLEHDRKAHPGGSMAGFVVWMNQRWREWEQAHGRSAGSRHTEADHAAFDAWLAEQVEVGS